MRSRKNYQILSKLASLFRFLEYCLVLFVLLFISWIIYYYFCDTQECFFTGPSSALIENVIKSILVFFGLTNIFRIVFVFLLNDPDDESEDKFYLSLIGLTLTYFILGFFVNDFSQIASRTNSESPVYIFCLFTFGFSLVGLLSERGIWDKFTLFLKVRISYTLITLILLIFNPGLGLVVTITILPLIVFWPERNALPPLD